MTPTHAAKKGTRYRHYVSRRLSRGLLSGIKELVNDPNFTGLP